jgi:lysophospholipase L1-like esterase
MAFLTSRVMRRVRPGVAATLDAREPYRAYWDQSNADALRADGPLWVALGDSTAQGVGASRPDRSYVGQLLDLLHTDDAPWRVVNLSVSGARIADVTRDQVPRVLEFGEPALVTCAVGANDVIRSGFPRAPHALRVLVACLPAGTVLATVPQGLLQRRAQQLNQVIWSEAPLARLRVADVWALTGRPWRGKFAADAFHPNDAGYADWCAAFAATLGLDGRPRPTPAPGG